MGIKLNRDSVPLYLHCAVPV